MKSFHTSHVPTPASRLRLTLVDESLNIRLLLNGLFSSQPHMKMSAFTVRPLETLADLSHDQTATATLEFELPAGDASVFLDKLASMNPKRLSVSAISHADDGAARSVSSYTERVLPQSPQQVPPDDGFSRASPLFHRLPEEGPPCPLIVIGTSKPEAPHLRDLLGMLPRSMPPIAITQHMATGLTRVLAARLNNCTPLCVQEATDGLVLKPGDVALAPTHSHLAVMRNKADGTYVCRLLDLPTVDRQHSAIDILFCSAADSAGPHATGILLARQGNEGAHGLKELRYSGGTAIIHHPTEDISQQRPFGALPHADGHRMPLDSIAHYLKERFNAHQAFHL